MISYADIQAEPVMTAVFNVWTWEDPTLGLGIHLYSGENDFCNGEPEIYTLESWLPVEMEDE